MYPYFIKKRFHTIALSLLFCLVSYFVFAQKTNINTLGKVSWGKVQDIKENNRGTFSGYIGMDDEMIYTYRIKELKVGLQLVNPTIILESFSLNQERVSAAAINFKKERKDETFEGFKYWYGNIYLLISRVEDDGQRYLLGELVNKETLVPTNQTIKLGQLPSTLSIREETIQKEKRSYIKEKNGQLLVLTNTEIGGFNSKKFTLTLFDESFNIQWTKLLDLPYKARNWAVMEIDLDNDGNAYVLGRIIKIADNDEPNTLHLLSYFDEGKIVREFKEKDEALFNSPKLLAKDRHNVIITGLLGVNNQVRDKGSFYYRYNAYYDQREVAEKIYLEDLKYTENRDLLKRDGAVENYVCQNAILLDDGGAIIIGEQRLSTESAKETKALRYRNTGVILIIRVDSDGKIVWRDYVCKYQSGLINGYDTFVFQQRKNKLLFIFNDHVENYNVENCINAQKYGYMDDDLEPILVEMDFDGNQEKYILYDESKENYGFVDLSNANSLLTEDSLLLFFGTKKKNPLSKRTEYFFKVDYKE